MNNEIITTAGEYRITDLYIAAFLKARGYECTIEAQGKRCSFIFEELAKNEVGHLVGNSEKTKYNVNAQQIINEIKQLKAYVNNV